jgi:hypothetical protein
MDSRIDYVVEDLAYEMMAKLEAVNDYKGDSWKSKDWEQTWRRKMHYHFKSGNLIDLANYIAFGLYHGWEL